MRARTILAAALLSGVAIACSKPASDASRQSRTEVPANEREIKLVDEAATGAPVVSALEAGLDSRLTLNRSTPQRSGESRMVRRVAGPKAGVAQPRAQAAEPNVAVTEAAAPASVTAPSIATLRVVLAASPLPAPAASSGSHDSHGDNGGTTRARGPHGTQILIRGGMGAPDDDCKIHPGQGRSYGGIAINSIAPALRGRVAVNNPVPRAGTAGFTRIR